MRQLFLLLFLCTVSSTLMISSCKKDSSTPTNPCSGVSITVSAQLQQPGPGQANGTITVSASPSGTYTYSKDGTNFQSSGVFSNLGAGSYTFTAKNSSGCTGTTTVTLTESNPCPGVNIIINTTQVNITPCINPSANGSITVSASGSTGFTYNLNGGAYQTGNQFTGLPAGSYVVGVKDANGCTNSRTVSLANQPQGTTFSAVRSLINAKCGGCHLNGGNSGGANFDNDCSIVNDWDQINLRCVTIGNMPPSGLTAAEKTIITNWVNAGHGYTN